MRRPEPPGHSDFGAEAGAESTARDPSQRPDVASSPDVGGAGSAGGDGGAVSNGQAPDARASGVDASMSDGSMTSTDGRPVIALHADARAAHDRPRERTFAHLMKQAGYVTGITSKWQAYRRSATRA